MRFISDFFKGIPIGIANVIPGFSGGTMAVILNVYERFINIFSDFFRHPIKTLKDCWSLVLGLIAGIIIAIKLITLLLNAFPIPTSMFFVGLIIGSIPDIYDQAKKTKITAKDVIVFFLGILIVIVLPFLGVANVGMGSGNFELTFGSALIIFFLAILASATMVIPGVSGSMVLLALGYYYIIWDEILGTFLDAAMKIDFELLSETIIPVILFGAGVIIGIVLISKLIRKLLAKYPQTVYYAILGLLFASPFAILYGIYHDPALREVLREIRWYSWLIGFITMVFGTVSVNLLSKYERKHVCEK